MTAITRQQLDGYLDDALSDTETAQVEQALRQSDPLRKQLRTLIQQRDQGDHSVGAIWRQRRLSCPTREQLGSYLLQVLDSAHQDYVEFHLRIVGCSFCQANLIDLQAQQKEPRAKKEQRRRRYFESSAGYLGICREKD
jgi:hypothetical protein